MIEAIERLNKILDEVGQLDGIKDLRLTHEGTAALEFKGGKKLLFEYIAETAKLFLYTPLTYLPHDEARRLPLLEAMLESNFLKLHTGKGALAISRNMEQAIYQVELDTASLDAQQLDKAIDDLLKQRDECLYQLQRRTPPPARNPRPRAATSTVNLISGSTRR